MTEFAEADARLGAMHGYEPAVTGVPVEEWVLLPLVATGSVTAIAVKGDLPPFTWDF